MGTIIEQIKRLNPSFPKEFEKTLHEAAPNLVKAERQILLNLQIGEPFREMSYEECLAEIIKAIEVIGPYEISIEGFEEGGYSYPTRLYRWDREAIIRDRFGYLMKFARKLSGTGQ